MKDRVLSIEQMQELVALGVDTSKASLYWYETDETNFVCFGTDMDKDCGDEICPTFTLQDILEIIKKNVLEKDFSLDLELNLINNQFQLTKEVDYRLYTSDGKTLLQSAFQMLKWCKQNME